MTHRSAPKPWRTFGAALVALLVALSASGAQWVCACGLCPTSKALLQAEADHPCCAKAKAAAGLHAEDACGCAEHGQSVGAAEAHAQALPQAVALWMAIEPAAPERVSAPSAARQVAQPPRAPLAHGPPVWLATLNLLI